MVIGTLQVTKFGLAVNAVLLMGMEYLCRFALNCVGLTIGQVVARQLFAISVSLESFGKLTCLPRRRRAPNTVLYLISLIRKSTHKHIGDVLMRRFAQKQARRVVAGLCHLLFQIRARGLCPEGFVIARV